VPNVHGIHSSGAIYVWFNAGSSSDGACSLKHAGEANLAKTKPAQADRQRFQLHPSVNTWRTFDPAASIPADASLVNQVQSALQVMRLS
jgi:hypothetical protein